ncbi:MAG: molybdenum cofactor biosynthesis protein [Acidobacteria bacterium]|nr:molybdenum cofactor biosynthesis protein [Acidobacteriota bacterium]
MPDPKLKNTVAEHRKKSDIRTKIALITLSSSRSADNDQSGDLIQTALEQAGHTIAVRKLISDNRTVLRATLRELVRQKDVEVIITNGGTGISPSDITIETVRGMLDKELPGFNSLFMLLSYPQAKSAAMLSRAMAGTLKGKIVFCLPGGPRACRLATEELILPELGHMMMLLRS